MKIKGLIAGILGLLAAVPAAQGQQLVTNNWEVLEVRFSTALPTAKEVTLDGRTFSTLGLEGCVASMEVGKPALPLFTQLIEVPLCEGYEVSVSDAIYDTVDAASLGMGHLLLPAQPLRRKSDTTRHPLVLDREVYGADAWYRLPTAEVEAVGVARDRNLARLQFAPVRYNPVQSKVAVCREATVTVRYRRADRAASLQLFERHHTPAYAIGAETLNSLYPKAVRSGAPVRYLIVAHPMFRGQLNTFIEWKRRKGFITDIVYTGDPGVGSDTTSIAAYIKSQYTNATAASPAPTYLLLVGDVEQLPAFRNEAEDHVTDLYYTTWTTGDVVPDCYHGRFSAQEISQLTPQLEKTLMYEQYTFADPTFLDYAVMLSGEDAGNPGDNAYTYGDPSMDYAITHYINGAQGFANVLYFKNDLSIVPTASNLTLQSNAYCTQLDYLNEGTAWVNYTAHGGSDCWATPGLNVAKVEQMTNHQRFGVMIGNCCLTNRFQESTCLGEALLRRGDYCGAVLYIGGSNSTYWTADFYWTVGYRTNVSPTMSLAYNPAKPGAYDRLCHTHGESQSQWATSAGAMMMAGNMASQNYSSSVNRYYWEIYHIMGDPSLTPYLTQPSLMTLAASPIVPAGSSEMAVSAAPYAYVALTTASGHTLVASAFAGANGQATLTLPDDLPEGDYELTASAQHYRTAFFPVRVVQPAGALAFAASITPGSSLDAGSTVPLVLTLGNVGTAAADSVVLTLAADGDALILATQSLTLPTLAAGSSHTLDSAVHAAVAPSAVNNSIVNISATVTWSGNAEPVTVAFPLVLHAPVLTAAISGDFNINPGDTGVVSVTITNRGPVASPAGTLILSSPTLLCTATPDDSTALAVAPGASETRTFTVRIDSLMPQNTYLTLHLGIGGAPYLLDESVRILTGYPVTETFEGGNLHTATWTQGSLPWTCTAAESHNGLYSFRSAQNISDDQHSEATLTYTIPTDDSISFYYKVSSEGGYDKFLFYIDGNETLVSSGDVDWVRTVYPVSAGQHTFKFRYEKDYSVSDGSDCAWIDDLVLPDVRPARFRHDTLCLGDDYAPFGQPVDTQVPGDGVVCGTEGGTATVVDYHVYPAAYVTVQRTVNDSVFWWNDSAYTASGTYEQTLATMHGCDSVVTLILTFTEEPVDPDDPGIIGIETLTVDGLTVYPNPTTGLLRLGREAEAVLVYDALGRLQASFRNTAHLDLTTLPQGVYTLQAIMREGTSVVRVIKK